MAIVDLDLDTTSIDNPDAASNSASTVAKHRGRPAGSTNKKAGIDAPIGKAELKRQLMHAFNLLSHLVRSGAQFDEEEFDNLATGLIDLIAHFPPVRIILRLIGPIAAIGDIIDKVRAIIDMRQKKNVKAE